MNKAWVLVFLIGEVEYFWTAGDPRNTADSRDVNAAVRFHREADAAQVARYLDSPRYTPVQREFPVEIPRINEWAMGPDETKPPRLLTDEVAFREARPSPDLSYGPREETPDPDAPDRS